MSAHEAAEQPDVADAIRVTGGNPSPEELAAATAVLRAALGELAGLHRLTQVKRSQWERSRRPLRGTLERGGWSDTGR